MPIHKIEILGSVVEINYEEKEKEKLLIIINQFKSRLSNFKDFVGKVSDKKILFLAALKAEDQISDLNRLILIKEEQNIESNKQALKKIDLSKEIIELKDKISELSNENSKLRNFNSRAIEELDNLEIKLTNLANKIISISNEND